MWEVFNTVANNLGVNFTTAIFLIVFLGSLIFYAVDFKKGVLIGFILNAGLFMWFYLENLDYTLPIVMFFIHLVIMSFTLYFISKSSRSGYGGMI